MSEYLLTQRWAPVGALQHWVSLEWLPLCWSYTTSEAVVMGKPRKSQKL